MYLSSWESALVDCQLPESDFCGSQTGRNRNMMGTINYQVFKRCANLCHFPLRMWHYLWFTLLVGVGEANLEVCYLLFAIRQPYFTGQGTVRKELHHVTWPPCRYPNKPCRQELAWTVTNMNLGKMTCDPPETEGDERRSPTGFSISLGRLCDEAWDFLPLPSHQGSCTIIDCIAGA